MRKILFVVALASSTLAVREMRAEAGCGGAVMTKPAPPPKSAGLQIPYVAPKQGLVTTVVDDESVTGTLAIDGKKSPMTEATKQSYSEEILAMTGDTVTKEKVTFTAAHKTSAAMGQKQDADLPVKGKSYVIESVNGKNKITTDAGAEAAAPELAVLNKIGEHVGTPDKLGKMLGAKTFVKGAKVSLTEDELAAMMGAHEGMTASDVALTLTGNDGKTATFALTGKITGNQNGMAMTIDFTATVKVDIKKSRPIDTAMKGKMTGGGDAQGKKIELAATISAHRSVKYKD